MADLVLALDVPNADRADRLLERLPAVRWVKVGPVLFTTTGPALVDRLRTRGLSVFLDLKWHDIPNTVAKAIEGARRLGVNMVTVHALGGPRMLAAASKAADGKLSVVAVTVLTSHDSGELGRVLGAPAVDVAGQVDRLADMALEAGVDGLVCSVHEAAGLRTRFGSKPLLVTPGIRAPGDSLGDQTRVATVADAVRAGATHVVVGRSVVEAADPAAAWSSFAVELVS